MAEQQTRQKIVDSNEPGEMRTKLLELGWEQRRLIAGDYWFHTHDFKKVGMERKTVNDLLSSIGDRLSRQLEMQLEHYDLNILLIEGSWQMASPSRTVVTPRGLEYHTWSMVWNYLRRWQDKGITLELTVNEGHTVQRLNELFALYQKPYSLSGVSKEFTDDRVLAFPSGSRGKTAMACLTQFGSLVDVAVANPQELAKVEGIGEKKSWQIYNHFHKGEVETGLPVKAQELAEQVRLI